MNETPLLHARRRVQGPPPGPHLFLVLDCDAPLASSWRHSLAGLDRVTLGRAEAPTFQRRGVELSLGIANRWMSTAHARLERDGGRWVIVDLESTNGTLVNGAQVSRRALADLDVIELGHAVLLFRESMQRRAGDPEDTDAGSVKAELPSLRTLVAPFAADLDRLSAIARSGVSVVIGGESGTGKELVARAIHELSGRPGPFAAVNCGALSRTLVESELFGHRKGAFSGADEDRPGLVRSADKGTLFLDEIGDLPLPAQAALLRVLQESEVLAVGSTRPVKVDVRVLAATHRDLERLVGSGEFRADLLARLTGFTVRMPPLRWRREDLGLLIAALLRRIAPERAARVQLTGEAARALLRYRWPLNIRELEKCLAAAVVLAGEGPIELAHLPEPVRASLLAPAETAMSSAPERRDSTPAMAPLPSIAHAGEEAGIPPDAPPPGVPLGADDERKREELIALLRQHGGNVAAVARAVGKARMQIHRWIKRYGLSLDNFR